MAFYDHKTWGMDRSFEKGLDQETITEDDERLIRDYIAEKKGSNKKLSASRVNKIVSILVNFRRFLKTPYRDAEIGEVFTAIDDLKNGDSIKGRAFAQNSLNSYLRITKPFLQWMIENGHSTLPEKKINKIQAPSVDCETTHPDQILTPDEIAQLIKACRHPRDRALVSVLYESGVRVGELARLRWRDAVFDDLGVKLYVDDQKTGKRRYSRLTMSREALASWRNVSPQTSPDDPVFVNLQNGDPLEYVTVLRLLERLQKATGIPKRITPHLFRKSRITHMVRQNYQESVIKESMWGNVGTDMFRTYVRLAESDIDDEFLARAGVTQAKTKTENPLAPRPCSACHTVNAPTSNYCSKCGQPLTEEAKASLQAVTRAVEADPLYRHLDAMVRAEVGRLAKVGELLH